MNLSLGILIGSLLASLLWLPVFILSYRRTIRLKMDEIERLKLQHQAEFAELIYRFNHEGPIPKGVTVDGMTTIISWAVSRVIDSLKRLYSRQDPDTRAPTTELEEIALNELLRLNKVVAEFIESKRNILKEYDKNQGII